jgi:hypothetical protein
LRFVDDNNDNDGDNKNKSKLVGCPCARAQNYERVMV